MHKFQVVGVAVTAFLLLIGMMWSATPIIQAIGEVTPTPDGPAPAPTLVPAPTVAPVGPTLSDREIQELLDEAVGHLQTGNFEGAIESVDRVLASDPTNSDAFFVRGVSHVQLSNYQLAIDDFTRSLDTRPYDWTVYTVRADTYVQLGDLGEAMRDYTQAIYINPRYQQAYISRASLQLQRGNDTEAQIDSLIAQGIVRNQSGDSNGAIDFYTNAIALVENQPQPLELANAYYNRAIALYSLGLVNDAIDDYTRAIELSPDMQDAYMGRGFTYSSEGQAEQAGVDFQQRMTLIQREILDSTMSIGEIIEVEMKYGRVHRIQFQGQAGETVTMSARATGGAVDPLMILFGPDGGLAIMGDDDNGGGLDSQIPLFTLPSSGTYTLWVSHANGGYEGFINVSVR